eukprot:IDg21960t1
MRRIFGANWAALRGGGGRARGGGKRAAQNAPGLTVPHDAQLLLHPCNRPTALSPEMEKRILYSLVHFEKAFGTGIVTPILIESLASMEIMSILPSSNDLVSGVVSSSTEQYSRHMSSILNQLQTVKRPGWMRSFLSRHKSEVRKVVRRRALERHKAGKHQVELV